MSTCENCTETHSGSYASGRFCSPKCAKSFSSKVSFRKEPNKYKKKATCSLCGEELFVDKRANPKVVYHQKCKNKIRVLRKKCKCCGEIPCRKPDICKTNLKTIKCLNKEGIIKNWGSTRIYKELERFKTKLQYLYNVKEYSGAQIAETFGITNYHRANHFILVLKSFGIKPRSKPESQYIAKKSGRHTVRNQKNYKYKQGWHVSWNGNKIFYRSSYELNMCHYLDSKRIKYTLEGLRIPYNDTQLKRMRVSIVDFHLPDLNLIIEVKSDWTLDVTNMKDRRREYKRRGYKFKLLLNNKDYDLDRKRYYKRNRGII